MSGSIPSLVDSDWLAARLGSQALVVLDGSYHLPNDPRNARREFEREHVPTARFFDIDAIADRSSELPHMLPPEAEFAEAVGRLGIANDSHVVVYDTIGIFSAPRVWWTFRAFGHERVSVLDGGLPRWKEEGRETEAGPGHAEPRPFVARARPALVRGLGQLIQNLESKEELVLDARSRARFDGVVPEPRPGLRSGRIPSSLNLPFQELLRADGTFRPPHELERIFAGLGVASDRPVVTSCGSGVSACVLAFALHLVGHPRVAVYDGSWAEWGREGATPVEKR